MKTTESTRAALSLVAMVEYSAPPETNESFLPIELCAVTQLEATADEEFIEAQALLFAVICRKIRREWSKERAAKVRPLLLEANNEMALLLKPRQATIKPRHSTPSHLVGSTHHE